MKPPQLPLESLEQQQRTFIETVSAPESEWNALLAQRRAVEAELGQWRQTLDDTRRQLDEYERRFQRLSEAIERLSYPHQIEEEMMEQSVSELLRVVG